jgi:hypothetical protein
VKQERSKEWQLSLAYTGFDPDFDAALHELLNPVDSGSGFWFENQQRDLDFIFKQNPVGAVENAKRLAKQHRIKLITCTLKLQVLTSTYY